MRNPQSRKRADSNRWVSIFLHMIAGAFVSAQTANATFNQWRINELYSNSDGSVQFVEMFTSFDGQQFVSGQTIVSRNRNGSVVRSFTFPANLPPNTVNRFMLLATPGFSELNGGIRPDFTIPAGFLFIEGGTLEFVGADTVTYPALPVNGVQSISRFGTVGVNSPTNFNGDSGSVAPGNAPPTVQITRPAEGAVFGSPATLVIEAFATDPDGAVSRVEFFDGGNTLGVVTTAPFRVTFTFAAGGHILTARATDNLGASTTSAPVTFSVTGALSRPSVRITRPTEGQSFTIPDPVTIEAMASDPSGFITQVEFFEDANFIGRDSSAPYSITANLPVGNHAITARATNGRGVSTISTPVHITVTAINSPPAVRITNPADGASFAAQSNVTITAAASDSDGNVTGVEFFDNGRTLGVDPSAPFSVTTLLTAGEHILTAVATDNLGATTTSAPVRVGVATGTSRPTVRITNPIENTFFVAPAQVTIVAQAFDPASAISRVEFFNTSQSLGVDTSAPFSLTVTLPAGNYTLTARATNARGASTLSEAVRIVVVPEAGVRIDNPFPARISEGDVTIELALVADGLVAPIGMAVPPGRSSRVYVYDQSGVVYVMDGGVLNRTPFLDLRNRLVPLGASGPGSFDERGLLGLAVHPQFAVNRRLYTYTSEPVSRPADFTTPIPAGRQFDHQSVIAEWRVDPNNPARVDTTTRREILRIDQPQFNHNAGTLRFGPDGHLYIALGDGGGADDMDGQPFRGAPMVGHNSGNGQTITNVYGTILRINVDGSNSANGQYGIPADNPFVGQVGVDEIFAFGFRNPYGISFDLLTGGLYAADAGQNQVEEVNLVTRGGNFGWNIKEGNFYFNPNGDQPGFITTQPVRFVPPNLVPPIAEYDHDDGIAVIGGFVYRGSQIPALSGRYVFGDYLAPGQSSGRLFFLDGNSQPRSLRIGSTGRSLGMFLKGFGQDASGEIYVLGSQQEGPFGSTGRVLKIVPLTAQILFTDVRVVTGEVRLTWSGGAAGPFTVQRKQRLSDGDWTTVATTNDRSITLPVQGSTGFFRVVQ